MLAAMSVVTAAKLLDATSCACVNHHALHLNVSNWTVPRCVAPPGLCGRPACNFAVSCGVRPGKSSTFLLVHGFDPTRVRPAFRRNPSGAASTNLFLFVRVVLSLRAVGSSLPITLLAAGANVEEFRRAAADLDVRVVVRDYVDPPRWAYHWHLSSFNKLLALGLTEYDRVIVLDLDMVVVRNVDILAHVPSPAMAFLQHAPLRVNDSLPLFAPNSGVLVLDTNATGLIEARSLMRRLTKRLTYWDGGDQSVWRHFYPVAYELPLGFNVVQPVEIARWADVSIIHDTSVHRQRRWRVDAELHETYHRLSCAAFERLRMIMPDMSEDCPPPCPSRNDSWATVRWIVGGGCSQVAAHARSSRNQQSVRPQVS